MKWLYALVAAALLAGAAIGWGYWQRHSVKSAYVNGLPPYNQLRGLAFILEQDCYIFEFKSGEAMYPLLGSHEFDFPAAGYVPVTGSGSPRSMSASHKSRRHWSTDRSATIFTQVDDRRHIANLIF